MKTSWVPKNENHAIEVVAVFIRFSGPVPDLLFRRALRGVEDAAERLGLKNKAHAQQLALRIENGEVQSTKGPRANGVIFSRNDYPEGDTSAALQLRESLQFGPETIVYRTWEYVSWSWQFDRVKELFSPVLSVLAESVVFEAIGIEYLDQFFSADTAAKPPLDQLLRRESDLIAPHVFDAPSLFHSHTGKFVRDNEEGRILQVVRVDAVELEGGSLAVNIVTTEEHRYPTDADSNPEPLAVLGEIHVSLKSLLANVIVEDQAKRIYLTG